MTATANELRDGCEDRINTALNRKVVPYHNDVRKDGISVVMKAIGLYMTSQVVHLGIKPMGCGTDGSESLVDVVASWGLLNDPPSRIEAFTLGAADKSDGKALQFYFVPEANDRYWLFMRCANTCYCIAYDSARITRGDTPNAPVVLH